jgi:hypothetical protein
MNGSARAALLYLYLVDDVISQRLKKQTRIEEATVFSRFCHPSKMIFLLMPVACQRPKLAQEQTVVVKEEKHIGLTPSAMDQWRHVWSLCIN